MLTPSEHARLIDAYVRLAARDPAVALRAATFIFAGGQAAMRGSDAGPLCCSGLAVTEEIQSKPVPVQVWMASTMLSAPTVPLSLPDLPFTHIIWAHAALFADGVGYHAARQEL